MYQYVVSAQKPTSVTHVLKGHFMSPDELNLIICKSTRIEFHTLTPDGLVAQFDLGIHGRVSTCKLYKASGEPCELLFVATERRQYFVLSYDSKSCKIVTRAKGEITNRVNRPNENGQIGIIDPEGRVVGLNLYQGQFDVIPMDSRGQLRESFNIRLEEINVIDIQFLYGYQVPTICVLYEDNRNSRSTRHIKTYGISLKDMEFTEGPWSQPNIDLETNMIIPIPEPAGGVLILGLETIAYRNGRASGRSGQAGTTIAIPVRCGLICAYAPIDADGLRWLLCDEWGGLHVLALQVDKSSSSTTAAFASTPGGAHASSSSSSSSSMNVSSSSSSSTASSSMVPGGRQSWTVVDLTMEFLGETSIASSIAYLDNGYVFIGSSYGDSQLIRLLEERDEGSDSYIEVIQTVTNLGPIVDFCVVDLDRQGQGQIVTCSGAFKDGSLRVVRNGIGIDEQANVELPGIRGMWSLRGSFSSKWDRFLVQTFINETRILAMEEEELAESDIGGFDSQEATLFCGNMVGDYLVQVTKKEVRIAKCSNVDVVHWTWTPPSGRSITVAHANASQVLLALNGNELAFFEIDANTGALESKGMRTLEHEISCLNISPLLPNQGEQMEQEDTEGDVHIEEPLSTDVAAVGMWTDVTIRILALPSLEEIHREKLGVETIPRSLCFATLEGHDHLIAGLGDGKLFTFSFARGGEKDSLLTNRKKITLGSRPISLSKFRSKDSVHIFAGTDRPTVIYSSGNKLLYSNVNQREVTCMASFNTESFPECLALASEEDLTIGTINEIQKLHIRSYPLGEQPRRICHQKASHSFAVCTLKSGAGVFRATAIDGAKKVDELGSGDPMDTELSTEDQPDMMEVSYVRLLDDSSFDVLDSFQLDEFETGCSIICCKFQEESESLTQDSSAATASGQGVSASNSSSSSSSSSSMDAGDHKKSKAEKEYIVVGTAYAIEGEQEPNKGRILVFEVTDKGVGDEDGTDRAPGAKSGVDGSSRKLMLIAEKQTRGAVYCLNAFNGKLLAGINSKVKLYSFLDKGPDNSELVPKCEHQEHILVLKLESRGDFIIVGDIMKSVSLLVYRALDDTIEEIARDYNANWTTAVAICDDDNYLGAETHMNLFTVQKNSEAATEEARHMLKVVGEYHLGESVNQFRHGSLVMQDVSGQQDVGLKRDEAVMNVDPVTGPGNEVTESLRSILSSTPKPQMLFGSVNGVIGVIASLSEAHYKLLKRLERALAEVIQGVGGLSHAEWRSFSNDRKKSPCKGFVDGDLIESFLDLDLASAEKVVDRVNGKIAMKDDEDIASILTAGAGVPASDALNLNLDVDTLTRFVEDLSRLH